MTVTIHPTAAVSHLADIEPSELGSSIIISEFSVVDSFVKVKPAGGLGDFILGPRSYINSGCVIYTGNGVNIGSDVLIAANCTLAATNHAFSDVNMEIRRQGFQLSRGGITVEDNVWIGANSVLLDGAYIHSGSVIAAGSVVRGVLPGGSVFGGVPAKLIRAIG